MLINGLHNFLWSLLCWNWSIYKNTCTHCFYSLFLFYLVFFFFFLLFCIVICVFVSPDPKSQCDLLPSLGVLHMSVNFHTFDIFIKTTRPILIKLGQKGCWLSSLCVRQFQIWLPLVKKEISIFDISSLSVIGDNEKI